MDPLCHTSAQQSSSAPARPQCAVSGRAPLPPTPGGGSTRGCCGLRAPASWEALASEGPPSVGCPPRQEPGGGWGKLLTSPGAWDVRAVRTSGGVSSTSGGHPVRLAGAHRTVWFVLFVSRGEHCLLHSLDYPSLVFKPKLRAPPGPHLTLGVDATRQVRKWSFDRASPCCACAGCGAGTRTHVGPSYRLSSPRRLRRQSLWGVLSPCDLGLYTFPVQLSPGTLDGV